MEPTGNSPHDRSQPPPAGEASPAPRGVLSLEKRQRIIALLANGSSRRVAARCVGCSPSTITRTAQRDPEFAEQLARAEQVVEVEALRAIRAAAKTERYWRAAAWLLERRNPEDFGPERAGLFTVAQVFQLLVQVLAALGSSLPEGSRQEAIEKLGTLLLEFDGKKPPPAASAEPTPPAR